MRFKLVKKAKKIIHPVPEFQGYFVTRCGDIWSERQHNVYNPDSKIYKLKPSPDGRGYLRVSTRFGNRIRPLKHHRAVGITFIPNPNNHPILNHIDGIKTNNPEYNLEWTDHLGNMQHAKAIGKNFCPKKWR